MNLTEGGLGKGQFTGMLEFKDADGNVVGTAPFTIQTEAIDGTELLQLSEESGVRCDPGAAELGPVPPADGG
jgi:hypothetical protein